MNYINKNILQKELYYDGTLILKYYIEYPSIIGYENFNSYNKKRAIELKNKSENELYKEAIQTYKYNKENGYPIMVYEVYHTFDITLNRKYIVSLYTDEYIFSGGAHGNTIRTSRNLELISRYNDSSCKFF